jgi:rod shape-determining protein MreD
MLNFVGRPTVRLTVVAFLVLAIQKTLCADLKPFGVTADLMLLGATAAGAVGGAQRGALAGFVFGLMFDLVLVTPFGMTPLVYGLAGFVAGSVHALSVEPTWWLTLLVVAATSAAAVFGLAAIGTFVGLDNLIQPRLIRTALVVGVIDGLLSPLAVPIQRWCLGIKRVVA